MCYAFAKAQSPPPEVTQQWSLQHDNDFVFAIDRYYTAGTFVTYRKTLSEDFIFKKDTTSSLQLDITLGQETYTPRKVFETDFELLDRPYAGYVFLKGGVTKASTNRLWGLTTELGLAGPQSQAGGTQRAYHRLINEFLPLWYEEIENSTHVNIQGTYVRDYILTNAGFFRALSLRSKGALGTRQIFAEQEALLFVGKRDGLSHSAAFNRIGNSQEFFGYVGAGYRYVALNALIEGHPFGDASPFTLPIASSVFKISAGITYRSRKNTFNLQYNLQTKEAQREGRLEYTTMIIARSF